MSMFVVSPDLITRFADGQVHLHTLETARSVTFPNLWVVNVLDYFSLPASDDDFFEKYAPAERRQVGEVLDQLKNIGALKPVSGDDAAPLTSINDSPGVLIDTCLRPLSESIYRLSGTLSAISTETAQAFELNTGQQLREHMEALVTGAATLERELAQFVPTYIEDQLRELGIDANSQYLKIHIGAGQSPLPGWVNIDSYPAELALDVTWGLPFADGAADYVFMSHILEHLFYPDGALGLLQEVRRVLAPGGRVRIIVPDVEKCLRAYVDNDETFFNNRMETWTWWDKPNTRLEDFLEYSGAGPRPSSLLNSHKFGYDFETLSHVLAQAGFETIERSDYMKAEDEILRVDDVSIVAGAKYGEETYSLFVEAINS
jgi:predicted SAM-dependent methyltransferase